MEFWITLVGLLRRKRVLIPAVLVAVTFGAVAYLGTPVTYVSSTTMVLTTTQYGGTESQDPASPTQLTNPMLSFSDSLRTTSAILISSMNTDEVLKQLGVERPTQLYVNDGRTNPELLGLNGPFLYIVAHSPSPDEAKRVVVGAQKLMRQKLVDWQSSLNAPERTYVTIADVVPPSAPKADKARATKLGLMAFVLGFLLSWGIAYLGHQFQARRRARAAAQVVVDTTAPLTEDPEAVQARPAPRSPVVVAGDDSVALETMTFEELDEEAPEPAVVSTPTNGVARRAAAQRPLKKREPTAAPTPRKNGEGVAVTRPQNKPNLAVVRAPVKSKARSRNR
jgi:hypothetical protein